MAHCPWTVLFRCLGLLFLDVWVSNSLGYKKAAELLLDDGADINAKDRAGLTALHAAVARDQADIVNFLLKREADVNAADKKGCTPLFYAVTLDKVDIANTLLRYMSTFFTCLTV